MAGKQSKEKVVYTQSTSQLDLERRQKNNNESALAIDPAVNNHNPFGEEEEAYVNVDPIYQNHADDTHKPLDAEKGPEAVALKAYKESLDKETDYSSDQKPSGAYADETQPSSQESDGPFGEDEDSGEGKNE